MEDNNSNPIPEQEQDNTPKTFDDVLKDPSYQSEFDKRVAKAIETSKAKWQKEAEKERNEAEALAKMSEEEKHQHELDKLEAERVKAVNELNAYRLKDEASRIVSEKGLDVSLIDLIDFSQTTAENVKERIDSIESAFNRAVERAVNEKLRQPSPQSVRPSSGGPDKEYLDSKYKNNPFYRK